MFSLMDGSFEWGGGAINVGSGALSGNVFVRGPDVGPDRKSWFW